MSFYFQNKGDGKSEEAREPQGSSISLPDPYRLVYWILNPIQKGTRVLISLWESLMFGRVPKNDTSVPRLCGALIRFFFKPCPSSAQQCACFDTACRVGRRCSRFSMASTCSHNSPWTWAPGPQFYFLRARVQNGFSSNRKNTPSGCGARGMQDPRWHCRTQWHTACTGPVPAGELALRREEVLGQSYSTCNKSRQMGALRTA